MPDLPAGAVAVAGREPITLRSRRCRLCEAVSDSDYCSPECAQAAAMLAQLAEQLHDPALRTPEAWALIWPAILHIPSSRIKRATGVSDAAVSLWKSGKRVPRPETWMGLCRA